MAAFGGVVVERGRVAVSGAMVVLAHTVLAYTSFASALVVGLWLHYYRIVKNGVAGYPYEWWPSVSATIGDWFPERNLFQVVIAITSGPRFLLVLLCAVLTLRRKGLGRAVVLLAVGMLRTFSCGGWVYVTSTDHSLFHDAMMGTYLGLTPPWMILCATSLGPGVPDAVHKRAQRLRMLSAGAFYACTPFMVHLYLRHKRDHVPGMYTYYSLLEWSLVVLDVLYDAASAWDLEAFSIEVKMPEALEVAPQEKPAHAPAEKPDAAEKAHTAEAAPEPVPAPASPARGTLLFLASQISAAFLLWTSTTVLISMIFYFSVYNMGVGGQEVLIMSQMFGVALLAFTPLLRLFAPRRTDGALGPVSPRKVGMLWLLCVASLASYLIRSPDVRLFCMAFANAVVAIASALQWTQASEHGALNEHVATWLLGLVLTLVLRYWNHGNNPAWPYLNRTNGGWQFVLLPLLCLCLVPFFVQPEGLARPHAPLHRAQASGGVLRPLLAGAALGAWLAEMHTLLGDSGTLIAWGWTGYPVRGPMPVTHGALVIGAIAAGIASSMYAPKLGAHPGVFAANALATFVVFWLDEWPGFAGALGVAFTLPTMAAPLLHGALAQRPLGSLFVAWSTYTLLAFLGVLTVAYAFLPGAWVMREHTGLMLVVQHVLLLGGVWNAHGAHVARRINVRSMPPSVLRAFWRGATAVLLALVAAAAVVPWAKRVPASSIVPNYPEDRVFTAGIWTVHFGFDQNMLESSRRMSSLLGELKMDVVGLLESDLHRPAFANRDLTLWLAQELGMYVDLGPNPKKHTWGAVLLSKFPILRSEHHQLPSPHGELAPAIHAVLDVFGVPTHVVVSHNGQEEDALDRTLQTTELARIMREAYPEPLIFLGYVVTRPHARRPNPYEILFHDGRLHDVDPTDMDRWCQYLGFRGVHRVGYARVSRYTVSDTELQTFKLRMPTDMLDPDRDVCSSRVPMGMEPSAPWRYPDSLVKPGQRVNETHLYSPVWFPQYFEEPEPEAEPEAESEGDVEGDE
mgnify:FL=1